MASYKRRKEENDGEGFPEDCSLAEDGKEFRNFLYNAQGSLSEVEYYLHLAHRLGYLDDANYTRLEEQRAEMGRVPAGFIASIDRQIAQGHIT